MTVNGDKNKAEVSFWDKKDVLCMVKKGNMNNLYLPVLAGLQSVVFLCCTLVHKQLSREGEVVGSCDLISEINMFLHSEVVWAAVLHCSLSIALQVLSVAL